MFSSVHTSRASLWQRRGKKPLKPLHSPQIRIRDGQVEACLFAGEDICNGHAVICSSSNLRAPSSSFSLSNLESTPVSLGRPSGNLTNAASWSPGSGRTDFLREEVEDLRERMATWNTSTENSGNDIRGTSNTAAKRKTLAPDHESTAIPHYAGEESDQQDAVQMEVMDIPSAAKRSRSDDFEIVHCTRHPTYTTPGVQVREA